MAPRAAVVTRPESDSRVQGGCDHEDIGAPACVRLERLTEQVGRDGLVRDEEEPPRHDELSPSRAGRTAGRPSKTPVPSAPTAPSTTTGARRSAPHQLPLSSPLPPRLRASRTQLGQTAARRGPVPRRVGAWVQGQTPPAAGAGSGPPPRLARVDALAAAPTWTPAHPMCPSGPDDGGGAGGPLTARSG